MPIRSRQPGGGPGQAARGDPALKEVGYEVRDRRLVNMKTGEQMTVELLSEIRPSSARRVLQAVRRAAGVAVTVRTVDVARPEPGAAMGFRHIISNPLTLDTVLALQGMARKS